MSTYDYEDDDLDTPQNDGGDLVKQLRKANKQKEKELADLKSQFENLSKAQRERAIKDALASRGVNQKIASFIPQDIDPTEESVSKWLADYADVFGFEQAAPDAKPNIDPTQAKQYQKMTNTVQQGNTPDHSEDVMRRLLNANSREELDEVIKSSGL
jgi:DNA uptake protein ComE-like DNA-binding protein